MGLAGYLRRTTYIANRYPKLQQPSIYLQHVRRSPQAFEAQYQRLIGQLEVNARHEDVTCYQSTKTVFLYGRCRGESLQHKFGVLQYTFLAVPSAGKESLGFRFQSHPEAIIAGTPQSRDACFKTSVSVEMFRICEPNVINLTPVSLHLPGE